MREKESLTLILSLALSSMSSLIFLYVYVANVAASKAATATVTLVKHASIDMRHEACCLYCATTVHVACCLPLVVTTLEENWETQFKNTQHQQTDSLCVCCKTSSVLSSSLSLLRSLVIYSSFVRFSMFLLMFSPS